jgi:drug/metabolite transporter (DMT)-like permease
MFGAATPAAAVLGDELSPFVLAGLLYLGAALAVAPFAVRHRPDRQLARRGLRRLAIAVVFGGMTGPVLLMVALDRSPAATVSLLLNLEVVFTVALAAIAFGEQLGRRVIVGVVAVAGAGVVLGWSGDVDLRGGALFAAGACAAWAIDNTVTANLDAFTPQQITLAKGVVAGSANLVIGVLAGGHISLVAAGAALVVGAVGYGASITLWISGARELGAARGQLIFAVAPFVGAVLSWIVLGDELTIRAVIALALAAIGVVFVVDSAHSHRHVHEPLVHDHAHRHDDAHHDHLHEDGFTGRHSHVHAHDGREHAHDHVPDLHHRHAH